MEVYTLDSLLRREEVFDRFESLIWTEKFQDYGDFEFVVLSTQSTRRLFKPGLRLAMNESYRVMTVETVEEGNNEEGKRTLKLKGKSVEAILEDRVARALNLGLNSSPAWRVSGTPAAVARQIFNDICVAGMLSVHDKIPFIVQDTLMPTSDIPEPPNVLDLYLEPQTVYDAIKNVCEVWGLGFRILRNFDQSQLYWDVYSGRDRTSGQTSNPPVIFATELDNLTNTTELNTIEGAKNVAHVACPTYFLEVYPNDVPTDVDGLDRRVLMVKADDITAENGFTDIPAALLQRGKEELAKYRAFQAFDGEINQNSQYKYQRDYYLGDLVEMRNSDGVMNRMRVTEQIFAADREGERSYPTLAINQFVSTGAWLAWQSNQEWVDLDPSPTTWAEQP